LSSKTETGIGALWPASSTLTWGCLQFYAGTASDELEARYYNNNFGRFWSPDPAGQADLTDPQSWNQYAYAGGDPVNRNDPGGLWPCWVGVGESPDRSTSCSVITFVWQAMSTDPGPHGGGASGGLLRPYLSTSKKATADKALKQAETWAEIPKCDHALQAYGISSIEALLQGVVTESSSSADTFDGTESSATGVVQGQPPDQQLGQYFQQDGAPGAVATLGTLTSPGAIYLGTAFFDPSSAGVNASWNTQAQAIMIMHEAVHSLGDVGDSAFGKGSSGSINLTNILVQDCAPALKGKLGTLGM
jgi:RHS repeat-associated protein